MSQFPWTQTSSNAYERRLYSFEKYFGIFDTLIDPKLCSGREQYCLCSVVTLSQSVSLDTLRRAWIRFRWQHPQIACTINTQTWTKVYKVSNVEKWADETCLSLDIGPVESAYSNLPPTSIAKIYTIPKTRQLMLRAPHWLIDGRGGIIAWDAFLAILTTETQEDIRWGEEVSRLHPCVVDKLGSMNMDPSTMSESEKAKLGKGIQDFLGHIPSPIGPPVGEHIGQPALATIHFTEVETSRIVKTCKDRGWTMAGLIGGAQIIAQLPLAPDQAAVEKADTYHFVHNIDIRADLRTGPNEAVNLYYWSPDVSISLPRTLPQAAQAYTQALKDFRRDSPAGLEHLKKFQVAGDVVWDTVSSGTEIPLARDALYSSLGVVDNFIKPSYGEYTVEDFLFASDVTVGWCTLYLWTWRGKLTFGYAFNEPRWSREIIEKILKNMKELLLEL